MNYRRVSPPYDGPQLSAWDRVRSFALSLGGLVIMVYTLLWAHADRAAGWSMFTYGLVLVAWADLINRTLRRD